MALCMKNISCGSFGSGMFRANSDSIGWKGEDGTMLVHRCDTVQRAEWLEGKLRILCEAEESGESAVLSLDGFQATDFDKLWRHFETLGVYIKKHRPAATLTEDNFDAAMQSMEASADKVDEAKSGSVAKNAKEQDLLKKVEGVRDGLEEAVKGDKQALSRVFAANGCERIGRLRLVLDTVELEVFKRDQRWLHLRNMARTVESVLREVGSFQLWKPSEQDSRMTRRQMAWELRKRLHGDTEDDEGMLGDEYETGNAEVEDRSAPSSSAVSRLRESMESRVPMPMPGPLDRNPLAGGYAAEPEPTPMPDPPAPVVEEDSDGEAEADRAALAGGDSSANEDLSRFEDQEVDNPNITPAAPPGHQDDMGLNTTEEHRRMHYTRADSVLEGWVWKRSRFLKKWRRRWLVLTKQALESLKQRGGLKATEVIEAGTVHRVYSADSEVQMARCFCVVGNNRQFYMVCDDEAQKAEWIRQVVAVLGTRRY